MNIVIGEVKQFGNGTMRVLAQGQSIFEDRIWVDDRLLSETDPLKSGDRVVLATVDGQSYYLVSRVVRYG